MTRSKQPPRAPLTCFAMISRPTPPFEGHDEVLSAPAKYGVAARRSRRSRPSGGMPRAIDHSLRCSQATAPLLMSHRQRTLAGFGSRDLGAAFKLGPTDCHSSASRTRGPSRIAAYRTSG